MTEILSVSGVSFNYMPDMPGSEPAIRDISIRINKGDFIGIIGETGSGKSTLLQHFNGLFRPTAGTVYLNGEDIWQKKYDLRKARSTVGLVFQYPEYQLFEETVSKDIAYGPRNMGLSEEEIKRRVLASAQLVGVDHLLERSPFDLSGGQKRRVAIAGVYAMEPDVLVLDEPAAGLDPRGKAEIFDCIRRYHQVSGSAVVIVSHSMDDIARYVKRVIVMHKGQIFCEGTVDEVFSRADELLGIGLSVPTVTDVLNTLHKSYSEISVGHYDVDSAADEIIRAVSEAVS